MEALRRASHMEIEVRALVLCTSLLKWPSVWAADIPRAVSLSSSCSQGERLPISVNPPSVQKLEDFLTCFREDVNTTCEDGMGKLVTLI